MRFLRDLMQLLIEEVLRGSDTQMENIFSQFNQNEQMHQQMHQQHVQEHMDLANRAATGIEFGGFNPAPDMNPGMMSSMTDMGMF